MAEIEAPEGSQILGLGKTPTQWVEVMAGMGIDVSKRTLRERANATGALLSPRAHHAHHAGADRCHFRRRSVMPLEIYKRGNYFWAKGWVEYNGRPIAGPYRRSTKASTEAGARDWITRETEFQIRRYLIGDEVNMTFADAITLYKASPVAAK